VVGLPLGGVKVNVNGNCVAGTDICANDGTIMATTMTTNAVNAVMLDLVLRFIQAIS
jgi:hypothetical protein